jgi:hypothetical protein
VQQLIVGGFCGCFEPEAFSRRIIVGCGEVVELFDCDIGKVSLSWQEFSHSADCVFDTAFLPRAMCVAKESLDSELLVEPVMLGEFGSVIAWCCTSFVDSGPLESPWTVGWVEPKAKPINPAA